MRQMTAQVRKARMLLAGALGLFLASSLNEADAQVNVLQNRYDSNNTAANLKETVLNTANVATATFGKIGEYAVNGVIFAQPLYVQGLNMGSAGTHNVLYVATMQDTVYAFDADTVGPPLWAHDFRNAAAGITADPTSNTSVEPALTQAFVGEALGILSTPVIDLPNNKIYIVAQTAQSNGEVFTIHVLDIRTGSEVISQYIYNSGNFLSQRPALALANGQLYIAFASKAPGDYVVPWHGYLLTYNATTLSQTGFFQATNSATNGGGIWQSGGGPVIDAAGNAYFLTGNGSSTNDPSQPNFGSSYDGVTNFQESLLKFSYQGGLALADFFTPSNYGVMDYLDEDLTSSSPLMIPGTSLITFGSKLSKVYLINSKNLGHLTTNDSQLLQQFYVGNVALQQQATSITESDLNRLTSLAYWNRSSNPQLYVWPTEDVLYSYTFNGSSFVQSGVGTLNANGMPGASFSVSANGSTAGSGILWATTPQSSNNIFGGVALVGALHALNAANITQELWNSSINPADSLGAQARYVPPVVANGKVYAATAQGIVSVYGLRTPVNWTKCSGEYGYCPLTGSNTVRFGAGNSYFYKSIIGPFLCNTYVFGDPDVGVTKECDYKPETWTTCAQENGTCVLNGSNTVRFGQSNTYTSQSFVGNVSCNKATFGDPLVGVTKQCQYKPETWSTCAQSGGSCTLAGQQTVRYGTEGVFATKTLTGVAPCNATVFGNPLPVAGASLMCQARVY